MKHNAHSNQTARAGDLALMLNAGSSSLRFAVFDCGASLNRILFGKFDRLGTRTTSFTLTNTDNQQTEKAELPVPNHVSGLKHLLKRLAKLTDPSSLRAVGHRIVQGGPTYTRSKRVNDAMLSELRRQCAFAPEHLPGEIALMEFLAGKVRKVPQIACLDTRARICDGLGFLGIGLDGQQNAANAGIISRTARPAHRGTRRRPSLGAELEMEREPNRTRDTQFNRGRQRLTQHEN